MPTQPKAPFADCVHCPLVNEACVRGYAPLMQADYDQISLIVVGEAPGYHETQQGKPFVGPSGQLLAAVLAHVGIDPANVYYTNAVLCRPPANDLSKAQAAIECCQLRLINELAELPNVPIVALGNTALESLAGIGNITANRGQWHQAIWSINDDLPF